MPINSVRGLLRPTPALQEQRQAGQIPFEPVHGPRAGGLMFGWRIYWEGILFDGVNKSFLSFGLCST